ncbi:RimK/LysX family protein [Reichenbachiella agarivorans]|uniref:RimK/LysX family protein n=1 Tax=Reichenbachiella agarivorans TaxID=2979464 RepID=A0ABY6CVA5_9BACT|nr:RimK/LysX family protein [Reichenbachiella agarivorans]UXP33398.1 RimK/LysX family protein [Reichenbachiella agarivorans]
MIVIGRIDKIDLPEFELFDIDAKVDTGAYGSALHCHHVKITERNGKPTLEFMILDPDHPEYEGKVFYTTNFKEKMVKSSNGELENRQSITTEIVIFGKKRRVEFSLTDRSNMRNPILLGRKFLSKKFIVDVQLKNLSYNNKYKES